jgi:hypothetical protein
VFLGTFVSIGIGNIGSHCAVTFRFPHGFRGGPATVYYAEWAASGVYGDDGISVGKNADNVGRGVRQRLDGTLYTTALSRR